MAEKCDSSKLELKKQKDNYTSMYMYLMIRYIAKQCDILKPITNGISFHKRQKEMDICAIKVPRHLSIYASKKT